MYFYKENIELHKLKAENSKFEFHAVNRWYEDIKNHGIKNHLIISIGSIIIFLLVYNTLDTEERISNVLLIGSIFFGISCIFVILQNYNFNLAWEIRGYLGFRNDLEVQDQFLQG